MGIQLTPSGEYGRHVRVVVGPVAGGEAKTWSSDSMQSVAPDIPPTLVTGVRISFDVSRDAASEPSQGSVKLHNLSASSRAWLQAEGLQVRLEAGYGETLRTLFVADIADVWHAKQGVDWISTLESGDGEASYRAARIAFSGAPGISRRRVFDELARALGVPTGYVASIADTSYRTGVTLAGPVRQYLDELCEELDLRWSIQDGALQVVEAAGATTEQALVVSAESGLIGRSTLRRADDGKAGVAFKVRLNGLLIPGRAVVLDDADNTGTYVVEKVVHKGDSGNGGDYVTEVEATESAP
jgi:hypothetical protein